MAPIQEEAVPNVLPVLTPNGSFGERPALWQGWNNFKIIGIYQNKVSLCLLTGRSGDRLIPRAYSIHAQCAA